MALRGPMYNAPTEVGGSSEKRVIIGKNAASVLPDAVEAQSSTFLSVLKIASPAATCIALKDSQPLR